MTTMPSIRRIPAKSWLRTKRFCQIAYKRIYDEGTFDQAAALSYHTIFSLLPVFVLLVLVLSMLSSGGAGSGLDKQVQDFIYKQFKLDALAMTDQSTGEPVNLPAIISDKISHARTVVQNPLTGLIGFAVLVYAASKIMMVIEAAFNRIYGAPKARSWSRRITLYWCVLTLGPLLMAASIAATDVLYRYAAANSYMQSALMPATFLAGFFVSWILMIVLYKVVPGTHVNWSSALIGGFVGAFLWELAKNGFGIYVRTSVGSNNWYGTLAIIPLFMFWIYLTWAFVLLGLHIAYIHQFYPVLVRRHIFMTSGNTSITDLRWILPLGVLLYQRFRQGKATLAYEAADALNLPTETAEQFLQGLEKSHIVHCIDSRSNGYTLARPPETITALDLINSAKSLCALPAEAVNLEHATDDPAHTPALADLETYTGKWYAAHTLIDLAGDAHAVASK